MTPQQAAEKKYPIITEEEFYKLEPAQANRAAYNRYRGRVLSKRNIFIEGAQWKEGEREEQLIQSCKECGIFAFIPDGTMCMNGHPVIPHTTKDSAPDEHTWVTSTLSGQEWVSVEDGVELEDGQIVDTWNGVANRRAIYKKGAPYEFMRHIDSVDSDRAYILYYTDITHWMPLPTPPITNK